VLLAASSVAGAQQPSTSTPFEIVDNSLCVEDAFNREPNERGGDETRTGVTGYASWELPFRR
jgi:hypothetical protein